MRRTRHIEVVWVVRNTLNWQMHAQGYNTDYDVINCCCNICIQFQLLTMVFYVSIGLEKFVGVNRHKLLVEVLSDVPSNSARV